ncbi:MAG: hypothetical protein EXR27_19735 [Betaproteobacteria bacterium]|nr:hypothetical protein [Betaproteobacteria bacterium]
MRYAAVLKSIQTSAQQLRLKVLPIDVSSPQEIERAFDTMRQERVQALIVQAGTLFIGQRRQIVELAARHRLPSMYFYVDDVQAGGLMSYGQNSVEHYRRVVTYVDKILKGAKPGDLPIEQPTRIYLAINRKTAKALGITIAQELLLRADEVID